MCSSRDHKQFYTAEHKDLWNSCFHGGWRVSRQTVAEASRLLQSDSGRDAQTTDWSETLQPLSSPFLRRRAKIGQCF